MFHCLLLQGNAPILLTGNGSSDSLFFFYFSYSVSLGETVIYYSLGGLFICGSIPGWLVRAYSFFFFDVMAAFGLDASYLFLQHVQVFIPLIGLCMCMAYTCFPGSEGNGQCL